MALTETIHYSGTAQAPHRGGSSLLRLHSDERLVKLTRRGNQAAYETLVARYEIRLLAFCRNMLASKEDAEDVLQEVFTSAYGAMVADNRDINVRPWLYRIARNRSLNHMRKQTAIGVDSMDVHLADHGASTADRVHDREAFRELISDVDQLAEQQRTALLLREIDAMSYDQIAEAMDTTVPAVKSLLVRARIGLADAAQSRRISCDEVRHDLGAWAEGLSKLSPPVRRHVKDCHRCGETHSILKQNNKRLAALAPIGPILLLKQLLFAHSAGHAATGAGAASTAGVGAAAAGSTPVSVFSATTGALATKAAAGLATAAIVTGGAIEVQHVAQKATSAPAQPVATAASVPPPVPATTSVARSATLSGGAAAPVAKKSQPAPVAEDASAEETPPAPVVATPAPATPTATVAPLAMPPQPAAGGIDESFDSAHLPGTPSSIPPTLPPGPAKQNLATPLTPPADAAADPPVQDPIVEAPAVEQPTPVAEPTPEELPVQPQPPAVPGNTPVS
jgi:RNA polymerase sigma factor (sigma-70 family)